MEVKRRFADDRDPGRAGAPPKPHALTPFPPTMPALVARSAERFGDRVFLPRRHGHGGAPVTFAGLARDQRRIAGGLAAAGIEHGDRVGLFAENRYEWMAADQGITALGAVDVPRGVDTAPAELRFILRHSGSRFAFVETDGVAAEVMAARAELPDLQAVCTLQAETAVDGVMTLPELMARGDEWLDRAPGELEARAERVRPDDLLTIVYTSGTTADPKGVMLTHDNVLSNVRTAHLALGFDDTDRFLSALPPWHMYERMMNYVALAFGAELVYTDRRKIKEDLRTVQPTMFAAVPRIWEAIHDGITNHLQKLPPRKRRLMRWVLATCRAVGAGRGRLRDRVAHKLLAATLLKKFAKVTGGRLRLAVSGGGALPAHVDETLVGLGLPILNGYGLTETSPVVSVRLEEDNRCGTIGPPLPETEVEIRDRASNALPPGETGVIWIRGPGVMRGYYRNPERTAEVLVDGWFNSGDLGTVDARGVISITGRAKDTIVLAGGENVEPEPVESAIRTSPFIEHAVVVGQDRKTLGALLVVSPEALATEVAEQHWDADGELLGGKDVCALMRKELDIHLSRAKGFRSVERVTRFRVLREPMTPDNGLLTPTLKVKRHVVNERYGHLISGMFEG